MSEQKKEAFEAANITVVRFEGQLSITTSGCCEGTSAGCPPVECGIDVCVDTPMGHGG